MKKQTDIYYIEKVRDGDAACFSPLVEKYSSQVFSLVVKIVGSREDAEELTQDVFMKAFGSLAAFRGDSSFSTWLYRIAYNQAISATRKKTPDFTPDDEQMLANVPDDEQEDIFFDEHDATEARLEKLNCAMERLSPDERAIILFFYKDDKSMKEIATIVGLTENNVKIKLFRIRQKLKSMMND